jgi:hypothetical protein
LGLWGAAMPITLEALKISYDEAHFVSYKLDFAKLNTHQQMEDMVQKARQFIAYTNHKVRINWDVTENAARFGFFWAKEYGCIYLENRKPEKPLSVIYKPALVLRDIWHLSKYTNIQKFQTSIQNVDKISKTASNAHLYTNAYAVAIGLIGTPLFFQETQYYTEGAVKTLQPLLVAYKNHRVNMYDNYTFPIGDEPCDAAYTGFINYKNGNKTGYLYLFRELLNTENEHDFQLDWLKNKDIELTNILTNEKIKTRVDANGKLKIGIAQAADFRIYKFDIL